MISAASSHSRCSKPHDHLEYGLRFSKADSSDKYVDSTDVMFLRWVQYGVFSPAFRTHCAGSAGSQVLVPGAQDASSLCLFNSELDRILF